MYVSCKEPIEIAWKGEANLESDISLYMVLALRHHATGSNHTDLLANLLQLVVASSSWSSSVVR